MIADLFDIKETSKYGKGEFSRKGVFARQFIPKGTFIYFDCKKCRTWTKKELARLSKDELRSVMERQYPTRYCDERLQYNNHSCNPNAMDIGNRVTIVVRDIKKGEEQTEDYRIFGSGDVHFKDGCKCGEPNCMKKVFVRPPSKELQRFWSQKIDGALQLVSSVNQPLRRQLLKEHPELSQFFKKEGKHSNHSRFEAKLRELRFKGPGKMSDDLENVFGLRKEGFTYAG